MFEQHPVPQQISSYQFRLVGDMTLKQFFQLAAGAIFGLIIYSLPLPNFLKWPLIVIVVIAGAAFAFLPIQDRPLEQWLVAFFRSIYSPTLFVWKKSKGSDSYFAVDMPAVAAADVSGEQVPQNTAVDVATQNMDSGEEDFLSKVTSLFGLHPPKKSPVQTSQASPQSSGTGSVISLASSEPIEPKMEVVPKPVREELTVPDQKPVEIQPQGFANPGQPSTPINETSVPQTLSAGTNTPTQSAQFSPEAAPPSPPTQPNVVVGQVMDVNGKIVDGAILEITDVDGRPVRALKTNRAGHFMIVTPLPEGQYKISVEKEGLTFEILGFATTGEIIAPMAIKAVNALPVTEDAQRAVWSI